MGEVARLVRFTPAQFQFLLERIPFIEENAARIADSHTHSIRITSSSANDIVTWVADELQRHGFDQHFEINSYGLFLESIIDVLTSLPPPRG